MKTSFTATESLEIEVQEHSVPIQHYLRQPQHLVRAIANPQLTEQLSNQRYRVKMRPLNFMELYHFQPVVVLKLWTDANGTLNLRSENCEIRGIDYINNRFTLNLQGQLSPTQQQGKTYLQGRANLQVQLELPPPMWFTPKVILETTGNQLLKNVLLRIKQRLLKQLLEDYRQWAIQDVAPLSTQSSTLPTAENLIA